MAPSKRKQTEAAVPYFERIRRLTAALGLAVLAALPTLFLASSTPATIRAATAPPADTGAILAGLAVLAAWVVTVRLIVTALAAGLGALPGACGRHGRRLAALWSPAVLRGLVRAALGASVVAGPVLSGTAAFADPPLLPALDRVVAVPAPVTAATDIGHRTAVRPRPRPAAHGHVVLVHPEDTLWDIAASSLPIAHSDADVARAWPRWYATNREVIGPDPGNIRPGQRLVPPS
jgi:resuscitation-promoting factor RpfA